MGKTKSKENLSGLWVGIIMALVGIAGLILFTMPSNQLGNQSKPYNASLGYQGSGYYASNSHKFYAMNISQFNQNVGTLNSASTVPTTSLYYTTTQPTTSIFYNITQTCQAGYIYGSDGLCHSECGTSRTYCTTGSYCYNNQCVTCQSGYVLGSDGLCHQTCESSTKYCTGSNSYCYNNQCVSCSNGDYLGTNGHCYPYTGNTTSTTIPYTTTINPLPTTSQQSSHGIQNNNFTFTFTLLNGTEDKWEFPITTYNYYVAEPRILPILHFNISDKEYGYPDYRGVITPRFFANVTPELTKRHNAQQFVNEVVNLKNQLTTYSIVFENQSIYPAEILGSGQGDCKDIGVLMASILETGNIEANYGMQIEFVYVNASNLDSQNQIPNHLILYIKFANGTSEFVDTTDVLQSDNFVSGAIYGWYENLTCTMNGCKTQTLCNGAYCDGVYYYTSEDHYNYCTNSEDVIGADNYCHESCGKVWGYYCSSGYSCDYQGYCAT